jgi:periplasmic divalent cation tolerance protein
MTDIWVLYSTFPNSAEALSVARTLVQERLVACVNIVGNVTSVYRWQEEIQQESEVVLIAKTSASQVDPAIAYIKHIHSYELPCITAWPLEKGQGDFLQWVGQETRR